MAKINWTNEQEKKLTTAYAVQRSEGKGNDVIVKALAAEMERTPRQIQGKLVHLKVYQVDEKAAPAAKDEGPTKKDYTAELRELGVPFDADGLIPCKKETIKAIVDFVKATKAAVA